MMIFEDIEKRIITVSGMPVIRDSDMADLYGVETKRVNEAVKNNPEKFPEGYVISLSKIQWESMKSKISTSKKGGKIKVPKAFTEKGLYMLATILKSERASKTTVGIIETFARIKKITGYLNQMPYVEDDAEKKHIISESGKLLSELFDDNLSIKGTETSIEINIAIIKIKHKVSRK